MIYQNENFGGSYDFRCRRHTRFVVEPHLHEYSELMYVVDGVAEVSINGKPQQVPKRHLLLIPPNFVHEYACEQTNLICAVFSNDLIPLVFREIGNRRLIPSPVDVSDMADIFEDLPSADVKNAVLLSGYLNLICDRVIRRSEFAPYQSSDSILYQKVISFLSENYTADITLKSVANTFGYNEKYLSHTLHDLTGINFRTLLCLYRIDHAKKLLRDPTVSISQVAFDSGFSAVNTFNRMFKSFTGMTPTAYRKETF